MMVIKSSVAFFLVVSCLVGAANNEGIEPLVNTSTTAIPPTTTTVKPTTSTVKPTTSTVKPVTTTVPSTTASPNTTTVVPPSTSTVSPNTTVVPPSTTSAPNVTTTDSPSTTTVPPTPSPPSRHWDFASFIGGMILAFTLVAIAFVAYRFLYLGRGGSYHTL